MSKPSEQENIHAAVSRKQCEKMGERNGWALKRVEPTRDKILKVNCVFEGEQTSFEDDRYEQ